MRSITPRISRRAFARLAAPGLLGTTLVVAGFTAAGCGGGSDDPEPFPMPSPSTSTTVASIAVQTEPTIVVGQQRQLGFEAQAAGGVAIPDEAVSAQFSLVGSAGDPAPLTLNAAGALTASAIGPAQVRVSAGGVQSQPFTITVLPASPVSVGFAAYPAVSVGQTAALPIQALHGDVTVPLSPSGVSLSLPQIAGVGGGGDVLTLNAGNSVTGKAAGFAVVEAAVTGGSAPARQSVLVGDVKTVGSGPAAGLRYIDVKAGDGISPSSRTSRVRVHYTGSLLDGTKFDSSRDRNQTSVFGLNGVIGGFSYGIGGAEGVPAMKVGGRRIIVMPANLGYADTPPQGSSIPPGSPLIFDVELFETE